MRSRLPMFLGLPLFMSLIAFVAHAQGAAPQNDQASTNPPAPAEATPGKPAQPTKKKYDPRDVCITEEDAGSELLNKRRQIGGRIIMDTFLLPTGGTVDVGLDEPFSETEYYFGALDIGTTSPVILDRTDVRTRQAADTDPLIKKGLMRKDRTIVNLRFPDVVGAPWKQAQLYIFTCQNGSPFKVSETTVRVSPALYSSGLAWLSVILG
ncbi:hypothetical protein Q2941_45515, partial [Bradyrhizobium sp. UFLA05-153]